MKRTEAETIFTMVSSVYDLHPERSGELAAVWVTALEPLDATHAMEVIDSLLKGRGWTKIPTVVEFVQAVKGIKEAERISLPRPREDRTPMPPWVHAWRKLRANGDLRAMPEQRSGYLHNQFDWPPPEGVVSGPEYAELLEWATTLPTDVVAEQILGIA